MNVVVVGLGYVGAVTAACLSKLGHSVVGVDVDPHKLEPLERGVSPIVEPGLDELVATGGESADFACHPISRLRRATPTSSSCPSARRAGATEPSTSASSSASPRSSGPSSRDRSSFMAIVYRSTVPPGRSTAACVRSSNERRAARGRRVRRRHGPRVPARRKQRRRLLRSAVHGRRRQGRPDARGREGHFSAIEQPVHALSIEAAESLKYACNAYHAVKITFANEIGRLLSAVDVDTRDVMRVFCEDRHLNVSPAYLRPGFSFGGSCLPKDLRALMHIARITDVDVPMLNGVMRSNESHLRSATRRILDTGERVVALLGLSFKPQTDDLRESPYVELAEFLGGKGLEDRIFDPIIQPERLFGRTAVRREAPSASTAHLCSTRRTPSRRRRRGRRNLRCGCPPCSSRRTARCRARPPRLGRARSSRRCRGTPESPGDQPAATTDGRRVLIIVQNLSVPFDRRVWLEACSLRDAGFEVRSCARWGWTTGRSSAWTGS